MVILGGWVFCMSEVPLYTPSLPSEKQRLCRHPALGRVRTAASINVLWLRGGLVFEAHRLLYHSA